jgi:hypothetical protein
LTTVATRKAEAICFSHYKDFSEPHRAGQHHGGNGGYLGIGSW